MNPALGKSVFVGNNDERHAFPCTEALFPSITLNLSFECLLTPKVVYRSVVLLAVVLKGQLQLRQVDIQLETA